MSHTSITCPLCETTGRARRKYAGRTVRCRHCGHVFRMSTWNDAVGRWLRTLSKTQLIPAKTITTFKGRKKVAHLNELRKLILLRDQGVITPHEFEELRLRLERP